MKTIKWIGFALVLLAIGCTSSKINSAWKADKTVPLKYKKILVLGLNREADRTTQMNMEIHLVGDLQELGYHAVSALQEYGPKCFDKMDEATALAKLKRGGVDAVVTLVMLDKEKEKKYVPGNMKYAPFGNHYNQFWGYRAALYHRIYEPGYYAKNNQYFWESNLYDMSTLKLVYSLQTQSFDPVNVAIMAHEYGQLIVKDMVKKNVLKKRDNIATKSY